VRKSKKNTAAEKIILKCVLKEFGKRTGINCKSIGSSCRFFEYEIESSCSVKGGEFLICLGAVVTQKGACYMKLLYWTTSHALWEALT